MKRERILVTMFLMTILSVCLALPATAQAAQNDPVFTAQASLNKIQWQPMLSNGGVVLTVIQPNGAALRQEFKAGVPAVFETVDSQGARRPDGQYTFELRVIPVVDKKVREMLAAVGDSEQRAATVQKMIEAGQLPRYAMTLSGTLTIQGGAFLTGTATETPKPKLVTTSTAAPVPSASGTITPQDQVINDDLIVTGSLGVGFDCLTDGSENFGFDTIKLKENNLQIYFDDTSATAGFPANDWRIVINDSTSGGANYFAIEDSTAAKTPFKIMAGAPNNSIYVSNAGKVGLGTATPAVKLHTVAGDTPAIRLDQDSSGGWTPQAWDVAGNESNFFVRDTTSGSKLPFRIQPGTPTNSLTLKWDGKVGLGTWSPDAALEIERTGETPQLHIHRTDGGTTDTLLNLETGAAVQILARLADTGATWTQTFGVNDYVLSTSGAEALRLDGQGNMKINAWTSAFGTDDLALSKGATETLRLDTLGNMKINGWTSAYGPVDLALRKGATETLRLDTLGNMKINGWTSAYGANDLAFSKGTTETLRVDTKGNLKINGWTSAFGGSTLVFTKGINEILRLNTVGDMKYRSWSGSFMPAYLVLSTNAGEAVRFMPDGSMKLRTWTCAFGSGNAVFSTGAGEALRLAPDGTMTIKGWNCAFGPTDMTFSKGTSETLRLDSAGNMILKGWTCGFTPTHMSFSTGAGEAFRLAPDGTMTVKGWICTFGTEGLSVATAAGEAFNVDPNGNMTLAGTLTESSDANLKENFQKVEGREVLDRLAAVPIRTWNFKKDKAEVRHMGPVAQDFHAAFGLSGDPQHIAPLDANGVALAAIQELDRSVQEKRSEIEALKKHNAELEARLVALERAFGAGGADKR